MERNLLIAERPLSTGDRRPDLAKIRGVDYGWLADQLDAYRRECGPAVASRLSLRHRLRRFASKPLPEKIGTVRARLSRLVSRG